MSATNRDEFRDCGATVIRKFWDQEEVEQIKQAIQDVSKSPGPMIDVFEYDAAGTPLFFNDFNNWRRLQSLKNICLNPKIANAFKSLTGASEAFFFHDHVICKKAGATKPTPWHLDKSYFMLDGNYTASFWTPTSSLSADQSLAFARGSHKRRALLMSKGFDDGASLEDSSELEDFTYQDVESTYERISWDVELGDVVVFDFYTIHCAPSAHITSDRQALSLRVVGEGTTFDARIKSPAPPFTRMGYRAQHGDPINENWFPKY